MKLELRQAFVRDVQWGEKTRLKEGVLFIDKAEALSLLAEEKRFTRLDMDLARPGESVRIIPVKDVIEPRCKLEGKGECFPGFIGGSETVGNGATLVLKGAAVVTVGPIVSIQEVTFPGNPGHRFTRRISRFRSFPESCTRFRNEAAFCCRTFLYT